MTLEFDRWSDAGAPYCSYKLGTNLVLTFRRSGGTKLEALRAQYERTPVKIDRFVDAPDLGPSAFITQSDEEPGSTTGDQVGLYVPTTDGLFLAVVVAAPSSTADLHVLERYARGALSGFVGR